ncbi:hypothetical protein [Hymenobacter negativus]|uniref:Uncharacterized protein n=1 Tax=Hymenobacter negativus TaxID=2795026 RepID=A0ABS3Q8K3_9BACT|nr:hypothetical protein [Hymenobacter negativus]MBO2007573.1 hypothetical protein [Hymenobacter negativus]
MHHFAHLDQLIELEHGEARQLYWQIGDVLRHVAMGAQRPTPRPVDGNLFLALPALQRVGQRLYRLAQREANAIGPPRQRPRRFRLKAEELVALMLHVQPQATSGLVVLGKVQQKSLNLESLITFPASR